MLIKINANLYAILILYNTNNNNYYYTIIKDMKHLGFR